MMWRVARVIYGPSFHPVSYMAMRFALIVPHESPGGLNVTTLAVMLFCASTARRAVV